MASKIVRFRRAGAIDTSRAQAPNSGRRKIAPMAARFVR